VLVGTSSARTNLYSNIGVSSNLQVEGTDYTTSSSTLVCNNTNSSIFSTLNFCKSAGSSIGSNALVPVNSYLGQISFQGNDGSDFIVGAEIAAYVDGTPGSSDMPGRLVFSTTADGASSPTERVRIANNGQSTFTSSNNLGSSGGVIIANNGNTNTSGVGTYSSSLGAASSAANTNCWHLQAITQGNNIYYLYGNGTTSFTSDARKKKNIETTRDGYLEDLSKLRVVKYNWRCHDDNEPKELGLIAQEVQQVFPGLVQDAEQLEGDDFKCKVLKGSVLPFMLLKALQEAAAKIETLEAKVAALEGA
jgi:hypothetical protein